MEKKASVTLASILTLVTAGLAFAPKAEAHDWRGHEIRHDIRFARHELVGDACQPGIVQSVMNII